MEKTRQTKEFSDSSAPPFRVIETPSELRVVLPALRVPAFQIGLFYAVLWQLQSDYLKWQRVKSDTTDFTTYLLVGIPIALVTAGLFGLVLYLINQSDYEEVTIDDRFLLHRYRSLGMKRSDTYDPRAIQNLRLARFPFWRGVRHSLRERKRLKFAELSMGGAKSCALCFDYRGRIRQIGSGLDEAGARELLLLLAERLPASATSTPDPASPHVFLA